VYPVSFGGDVFLPCVYGYGCTVRRTQGLTLHHGALYLDGRIYPRPRGHAYVAVSRFRRALGVYHYGPLRRSDWLPTAQLEDEQTRPSELSPVDWEATSESGSDDDGYGACHRSARRRASLGSSSSDDAEAVEHYRRDLGGMRGGSSSCSSCSESPGPCSRLRSANREMRGGASGTESGDSDDERSLTSFDVDENVWHGCSMGVMSGGALGSDGDSDHEDAFFRCAEPEPEWVGSSDSSSSDEDPTPDVVVVKDEPADGTRVTMSSSVSLPEVVVVKDELVDAVQATPS